MPIRSMDSILADEPSVHTLPVSAESDSPSEPEAAAEVETSTSKAPVSVKTKAGTKPNTVTVAADDADDEGDPDPNDRSVEGLRTALTAVRGDKRKLKKQWKETEKRAEEASRRIAHLEGQIAALSQRGAQKPDAKEQPAKKARPDFYGDPEAHISARETELREELAAKQFQRDATRSERAMKRQHEDYDDAKAAFLAEVQRKPYLWQQVADDPDPAEVVYEEGRKLLGGTQTSDEVAQLKARIAELEAAPASSGTAAPKPTRPPIPKSNAAARGTGNGAQKTWQGPRRFEELFPG